MASPLRSLLRAVIRLSLIGAVTGGIAAVVAGRRPPAARGHVDPAAGSGGGPSWPAFDTPAIDTASPTPAAEPSSPTLQAPVTASPAPTRDARATEPSWTSPCDGRCPETHPIKAKTASGIYHRPGGRSYDRTAPDRCYRLDSDAEADGFRAART